MIVSSLVDKRGAAMIELALVAPILALLTIGMVDLSNATAASSRWNRARSAPIEKIMQTTEDDTVENTLATEAICQVNGMNADGTCKTTPINASNVTVTWRRECTSGSGTMTQAPGSRTAFDALTCVHASAGTAKEADYIQVALTDKYTPMFPLHFASYNAATGPITCPATAGMRTQ